MVNPTNPTSVAIDDKTLQKITDLVKHERKDLIVLTDTVYATFVEGFHSIIKEIPENTICVYSYSKYFGVTGWRLGLIMMHEKNIINQKIQHLKKEEHLELYERYKTVSPHPEEILFIDRLEIDSRQPALAHTGGLSGPQQLIMALFSLYEIMDEKKRYKKDIHQILKVRIANLYNNMEVKIPSEKGHTYYYTLIDLSTVAKDKFGEEFQKYLMEKVDPLQFLFDLAEHKQTICLPGEGFAGPKWSIRVSLANLNDEDYIVIGKNIKEVLDSYYQNFKK